MVDMQGVLGVNENQQYLAVQACVQVRKRD